MTDAMTLEKLREIKRLLDSVPPAPFFASSALFPQDCALTFTAEGRDHIGAHPDLWAKIPQTEDARAKLNPLGSIAIIDLDGDRERAAAFFDAMCAAMADADG